MDILTALKHRTPTPEQPRPHTLWTVMTGDGRRQSRRLYSAALAKRIAARAARLGIKLYPVVFGVARLTRAQLANTKRMRITELA